LLRVLGVHRDQDVAVAKLALVDLRLVFGDTVADQRPGDAADGGSGSHAGERGQDRTSSDQGPHARDGERPDTCQPPQRAPEHASGGRAGRRTLRSLRLLPVREVPGPFTVGEQHGDVRARKPCGLELPDDLGRLALRLCYAYYCALHVYPRFLDVRQSVALTSSWSSTLVTPGVLRAAATTVAFSVAVFTGPRSVTMPFCVTILTLCAFVASASLSTTAFRTCCVIVRSASLSP